MTPHPGEVSSTRPASNPQPQSSPRLVRESSACSLLTRTTITWAVTTSSASRSSATSRHRRSRRRRRHRHLHPLRLNRRLLRRRRRSRLLCHQCLRRPRSRRACPRRLRCRQLTRPPPRCTSPRPNSPKASAGAIACASTRKATWRQSARMNGTGRKARRACDAPPTRCATSCMTGIAMESTGATASSPRPGPNPVGTNARTLPCRRRRLRRRPRRRRPRRRRPQRHR